MEIELKVPAVGESITSGVLGAWQKKEGEFVQAGEILFTLETDKVSTEIPAPGSGVLRIKVPEGAEVKIGEVVALIEEGEAAGPSVSAPPETVRAAQSEAGPEKPATAPAADGPEKALLPETLATAHEIGPREGRTTRKRLSPLRRKIAAQLVSAQQTAAMLTTFNECDMSEVQALRTRIQEAFTARHGVKLGLMSIFLKATVAALKAVPQINARFEGEELVEHHFYDIGVAVGTDRGLMVPVLRNVDAKSFAELEQELRGFASKAREGKIKIEDLQGGVFTISNGGIYGSMLSTPILNAPQSGILGLHKIMERPVALGGQVVIRPMMYLALSYDHRVVDGREAVTFLIKIKEAIEDPVRLMLEV